MQHALTVQPALIALADQRLDGARSEFEQALLKRRLGAAKDLEDAVDEAAKSVESVLQVLHDLHAVTRPRNQHITSLFASLTTAQKLSGYLDHLVTAAAGPRNHMASHGQGANVRQVPEELADASIAAAATAIAVLMHFTCHELDLYDDVRAVALKHAVDGCARLTENSSASSAMVCSPARVKREQVLLLPARFELRAAAFQPLAFGPGDHHSLAGAHPQQIDLELGERREMLKNSFPIGDRGSSRRATASRPRAAAAGGAHSSSARSYPRRAAP